MTHLRLLLTLCLFFPLVAQTQNRTNTILEKGWKFTREDNAAFSQPNFNDSKWQTVRVPHDWAIYGPFSINNDKQNTAITQDGQKEAMEHAGRTGGLPFTGTGWYRLKMNIENKANMTHTLLFDGAMSHAEAYVNGHKIECHPYGYVSFYIDITPFVKCDGNDILAVRLENLVESSRWYPGAGLYRNVHLISTSTSHIKMWGTQVTTPEVSKDFARVNQKTEIELGQNVNKDDVSINTEIKDMDGNIVTSFKTIGKDIFNNTVYQNMVVENPKLWSPEHPYLYTSVSTLNVNGKATDTYSTVFGIRTIKIVANKGFFLNGEMIKFKGVCNHHDLGPLGGIANDAGIRRQIRILKDMGCNAIRSSHNMPAPELVKACDEMGMMLMAESFDEWKTAKVQNGYHLMFDQWAEKDLTNLIRQYRNNPSIIMWCIGNEVPDQWKAESGSKLSLMLQNICHREDPTRPVTQGMDAPDAVVSNNMAAVMDVPGFNYRPFKYQTSYKKLPQQVILGSETASTLSSRGVYKFPVQRRSMHIYDDNQASSYDVEHCGWSDLPEDNFIMHDDLPYCMGEFVWTGFDYLGEPTPYYSNWPSHSSLFGIIDLAGNPKDRYYLYRSVWNTKSSTLHVLPHWTWPGREGEITPVMVYTSYPSAELFINGKSQGRRSKDTSITIDNSAGQEANKLFKRQTRYRLMWMDTKYEAGTLKVVAYDSLGNVAATQEVVTAGKPYAIALEADRQTINADGNDLSFITVKVVDKNGNLCPNTQNLINFKVKGNGKYVAGANGNPASLESFQLPSMKVFYGLMTAIVSGDETPGTLTIEATSSGLKAAKLTVTTK